MTPSSINLSIASLYFKSSWCIILYSFHFSLRSWIWLKSSSFSISSLFWEVTISFTSSIFVRLWVGWRSRKWDLPPVTQHNYMIVYIHKILFGFLMALTNAGYTFTLNRFLFTITSSLSLILCSIHSLKLSISTLETKSK